MRGTDDVSGTFFFSYVDLEKDVPSKHPLRLIRLIVNDVVVSLDVEFDTRYTDFGRPSIAPERLIQGEPNSDPVLDPVRAAAGGVDEL